MNEALFFQNKKAVCSLAVLCALLWGSAFPCIKIGYELLSIQASDWPGQILFAGWRFALAGLMLLGPAALLGKDLKIQGAEIWPLAALGFFQTTLQYVAFYIGLSGTEAAKASILNASGVFFSVILAHFIYGNDKLSWAKTVGCLLGLAGVVLVNLGRGGRLDFHFNPSGEGLIVAASLILSAASIYGKRLSRVIDPMVMTAWQLFIGGLILILAGLLAGGKISGLTWASGLMLFYLAFLSSAAFALWGILLKYNPVGLLAPFNFIIPVCGVFLSGLFLGENIFKWPYALALLLVCAGIWLSTAFKRISRA